MSKYEYTMQTIDREGLFITGKDGMLSTDAIKSMEYVRFQNDPVGTISGYYDKKLSIWCVSTYFLHMLNYDYESFMADTDGSLYQVIANDFQYPFSRDILEK